MVSRKKQIHEQTRQTSAIFDLLDENAAEELSEHAEKTEIAYLNEFEEEAREYIENEGKHQGISTGYPHMDKLLGSFVPGELLTIGGDTGHGKSLLAMNIAYNVYRKMQEPVLMVNLELTRAQAYVRFHNIAKEEDHDFAGIMIQRAPAVTYRDIDILMYKAKKAGVVMVVIDHLHFFSRSAKDSVQELSRIMKHFKECAVEHELPVILLSHVTPTRIMGSDGRVKKEVKPSLHNFKGSSSIEQDSDMVAFVYRNTRDHPDQVEFYMRKNRSRPLNTESIILIQKDWRLEEQWWPTKSEELVALSEQSSSSSSTSTERE